ncbi:MAG: DDE-type integrase/transposase/recombinase [Streptococcus sp.]|nr:DDE-type integrase/transposase/recombinase [Streptococcus sp.]
MSEKLQSRLRKWSEFRFSVIGGLLTSPSRCISIGSDIRNLSERSWIHPTSGKLVRFSFKTIERWYYIAQKNKEAPISALGKQQRSDFGEKRSVPEEVALLLRAQYQEHPSWSYQLHSDNLNILLKNRGLDIPSYDSVRRYLTSVGFYKKRRSPNKGREGFLQSQLHKDKVEVRSYESSFVNSLWHLDFHHGSKDVITARGDLIKPLCLCIMDDHSRLICHIQWYFSETSEVLIHGFLQALQKRGLPRSLLTDNGSAMISKEFTRGLKKLSIHHETTLPYSPYQNGKQEVLWGQVEGRLIAMMENKKSLSLKDLNEATCAWADYGYNKSEHSEIKSTPLTRFINNQDVSRSTPELEDLKSAFRSEETRQIRKSDGTISLEGRRFEIPSRYHHLRTIHLAFASWALDNVHIIDPQTGKNLCPIFPLNKQANSNQARRKRESPISINQDRELIPKDELAPLLLILLGEQAASGLPPPYQPKDE